jgi:hypothetical protein
LDEAEHARLAAVHAAVGGHDGLNESPLDSQIPIPPLPDHDHDHDHAHEHERAEGEDAEYDPDAAGTRISEEFEEGAPLADADEALEPDEGEDDDKNGPTRKS